MQPILWKTWNHLETLHDLRVDTGMRFHAGYSCWAVCIAGPGAKVCTSTRANKCLFSFMVH